MVKKVKTFVKEHEDACLKVGAISVLVASVAVSSYSMRRLAIQQYWAGFAGTSDRINVILDGHNDPAIYFTQK